MTSVKLQVTNENKFGTLEFGNWCLFVSWDLVIGIYLGFILRFTRSRQVGIT